MTDERGTASDDEARELAALYALDALDPDEMRQVAELLAADEVLAREITADRDALTQLVSDERIEPTSSGSSSDVVPSAAMRENVLSRIARTPQDAVSAPGLDEVAADEAAATGLEVHERHTPSRATGRDTVSSADAAPQHRRSTGHRSSRRVKIIAGLAGLGLAAGLALFAAVERPWAPEPTPSQSAIEQVLDASDAQRAEVAVGEGRMVVVTSPERGHAVVTVEDMQPPPAGHIYQAWWIREGADPVSAGAVTSGSDSSTLLEGSAAGVQQLALTVEPEGGSEQPTTTPLAAVDLPS